MWFSTSFVCFAVVVTSTFHTVSTSAIPYSSAGLSLYPAPTSNSLQAQGRAMYGSELPTDTTSAAGNSRDAIEGMSLDTVKAHLKTEKQKNSDAFRTNWNDALHVWNTKYPFSFADIDAHPHLSVESDENRVKWAILRYLMLLRIEGKEDVWGAYTAL
ncbi:hypothetical protein BC835DRAFT_1396437 [Cytidiella melzeri]|nr:hypothetical protein BC835DRAFT_1396437 [Cytidiella melzeri]